MANPAERGETLSRQQGCIACHSVDGSRGVGPTWRGMFGRQEHLADGSVVTVDEEYLKESILNPNAKLVEGYPPVMAAYPLSDADLDAMIAYFKTLSDQ